MKSIILIGYMGAGKTTVGHQLAKQLGRMFYDLDWYIEMRFRKTIAQIFEERGEDGFRELEHNMLHEVAEFEDIVISCGGGTPCFFDNIDYMNSLCETIYLKAEPATLAAHLKMGKSVRPLLLGKSPEELEKYIEESLREREPFYMKAKHIIPISLLATRERVDETVNEIRQKLGI